VIRGIRPDCARPSEDEPTGAVLPSHAPPQTVKPDDTARVSAPGQAGVGRRRPSPDLPTHRKSQRSAADDSGTDDDDDVIAPATRDIYRRDWAEFAA
jgi:hypothetical protein